jgi:hypothetical protein
MGCMNLPSHEEQQEEEELMSRVILEVGVYIDSSCVCIAGEMYVQALKLVRNI